MSAHRSFMHSLTVTTMGVCTERPLGLTLKPTASGPWLRMFGESLMRSGVTRNRTLFEKTFILSAWNASSHIETPKTEHRSEERRVGKECRARGATSQ